MIATHDGYEKDGIELPPVEINDFPSLKGHLDSIREKIKQSKNIDYFMRADKGRTPYNLRSCAYMDDFYRPKIIYPETTQGAYFYLDKKGYFIDKTCFMITGEHLPYLTACLSSELFEYAMRAFYTNIRLGKNGYGNGKKALMDLPIMRSDVDGVEELCCKIISAIQGESSDNQYGRNQLNDAIYSLYDISDEERSYIRSFLR